MSKNAPFIILLLFVICLITSLAAVQIISGIVLITALFYSKENKEYKYLWFVSIFYFVMLSAIATAAGGFSNLLFAVKKIWMILILPPIAVLSSKMSEKEITIIENLFIVGSLIAALLFIFQFFFTSPIIAGRYGFHTAPYVSGLLLFPAVLLCIQKKQMKIKDSVIVLITLTSMLLISVRSSLLALAISILFLLIISDYKTLIFKRVLILAVFSFTLIISTNNIERWNPFPITNHLSMIDRFVIWAQAIEQIQNKPIIGHGFNKFQTDSSKTIPDYYEFAVNETNTHNSYLMIAHSCGFIGYAVFWITFGGILFLLNNKTALSKSRWSGAAYSGLCGLLAAAFLDKTFFVTQIVLLLSFLAGIAFGMRKEVIE